MSKYEVEGYVNGNKTKIEYQCNSASAARDLFNAQFGYSKTIIITSIKKK